MSSRRAAWFLVFGLSTLVGCRPSPSQDPARVPRPEIAVMNPPLPGFLRGINLGNALDAPAEGQWGVTLSEDHFRLAASAGLDHVRLPVKFSAHASGSAPYAIAEGLFERVDWAVQQALAHHLSIIIDLHHYAELMKEPAAHGDRLIGMWQQIAARYQNAPPEVAFELLNEPCDALEPELLNPLMARALAAVRASNPTRLVIVDSYFWASDEYLAKMELPEDPNLVASFHMYQPILFTHQGMDWMGPEYQTKGVVFPGPPSAQLSPVAAARDITWTRDWFDGYNSRPLEENPSGPRAVFDRFHNVEEFLKTSKHRVYLGEFAVGDKADRKSRENWLRTVRTEAERRGIGWAYWDDGGHNKAMELAGNRWLPFAKAALFDP